MVECYYCGGPHKPAARDNAERPVCPRCASALLRACPAPLFTPNTRAAFEYPARRVVSLEDARAVDWLLQRGGVK
jgi:hypothetical protein